MAKFIDRFLRISHDKLRRVTGGNVHLSSDEYQKLLELASHLEKLEELFPPKLFAWGAWKNSTIPVEASPSNGVTPVRVTSANENTMLALASNGTTYGWTLDTGSGSARILGTDFELANAPMQFNLGQWVDVKMPTAWSARGNFNRANLSDEDATPTVLLDTETHLSAPMGDGALASLRYTDDGKGFIATLLNGESVTISMDSVIKRMYLALYENSETHDMVLQFTLWCEDGLFHVTNDGYLQEINFPFGDIRDAWPVNDNTLLVQNTDGHVFYGRLTVNFGVESLWNYTGKFDIRKLSFTRTFATNCVHLLTPDGRLYYCGIGHEEYDLEHTERGIFIPVQPEYRFKDFVNIGVNFLAIGRKAE